MITNNEEVVLYNEAVLKYLKATFREMRENYKNSQWAVGDQATL